MTKPPPSLYLSTRLQLRPLTARINLHSNVRVVYEKAQLLSRLSCMALAAGFFFAEYFARVAPSVMALQLIRDFHINAIALGSLSAFFTTPIGHATLLALIVITPTVTHFVAHLWFSLLTVCKCPCLMGGRYCPIPNGLLRRIRLCRRLKAC